MKTHLTEKTGEKRQQKAAAHHTNQIAQRKSISLQDNRINTSIIQKMEVAQLATRQVRNVVFNGHSYVLRGLLLRWAVPNGTNIQIQQTDHVGGSFNVRFTNRNGPAISIATARGWIQTAKNHHQVESSSEESSSDSGGE